MIFIFDNMTDPLDFATIIFVAFESPKTHKFVFVGKPKEFYFELLTKDKIRSFLQTYYPNLGVDFKKEIGKRFYFVDDFNTVIRLFRKKKYDIIGTTPNKDESTDVFAERFDEKSVFVFGSENGLSKAKKDMLARLVHYPLKKAKFLKIRHVLPLFHSAVRRKA